MSRLLLISPEAGYLTVPFQLAGERLGIEVVVASEGHHPLVPRRSTGLQVTFSDPVQTVAVIKEYHQKKRFDGVIATDDSVSELASIVAIALGLPSNPPECVKIGLRKDFSREAQKASGLRTPWFLSLRLDREKGLSIPNGVAYPCIVKPVTLSASRGVIRANNQEELASALTRISRIINLAGPTHPLVCLIEEYIPGEEYAVEGFLEKGRWHTIAIFSKPDPMEGPFFEETIYIVPAGLSCGRETELIGTVGQTCKAIGLVHGPVHAECRINDKGTWLIELSPRPIGGRCGRILESSTGKALADMIISNALGQSQSISLTTETKGVMMIPVPGSGILRRVEGIQKARSIDHVEEVEIDVRPGQRMIPWPEGSSYPGFIFAKGKNTEIVIKALKSAHHELNFILAPELPIVMGK